MVIRELHWGACPHCSSSLRVKHGESGRFLACSAYPRCDYTDELDTNAVLLGDDLCIGGDDGEGDGGTR